MPATGRDPRHRAMRIERPSNRGRADRGTRDDTLTRRAGVLFYVYSVADASTRGVGQAGRFRARTHLRGARVGATHEVSEQGVERNTREKKKRRQARACLEYQDVKCTLLDVVTALALTSFRDSTRYAHDTSGAPCGEVSLRVSDHLTSVAGACPQCGHRSFATSQLLVTHKHHREPRQRHASNSGISAPRLKRRKT